MTSMCDEFDDSDDMEDNDDEYGALRSILSWDEADDNDNGGAVSRSDAMMASVLRDRGNQGSAGMSVPPDMVQFSTHNDGTSQFQFFQANGTRTTQGQQSSTNTDGMNHTDNTGQNCAQNGNLTLQLPLPTPISSFCNEQQPEQNQNNQGQPAAVNVGQLTQEQQQGAAQQQAANFAQMIAQQAGNLFQQQQQQMRLGMPNLQTMQQGQPSQQQMHQVPQVTIPFNTDPNTFLQQLQFAQFQQQFMNAQQQQMSSSVHQNVLPINPYMQQPTIPVSNSMPSIQHQSTSAVSAPTQTSKKRPKDSTVPKKTLPVKGHSKSKSNSESSLMLVSASDTDADAYRSVKSKKYSSEIMSLSEPAPVDTSNMTEAEKVVANRDRNREHARNTRLRKKAYLEKLKATVDELCRERDSLISERSSAANLLVEMHNTRSEVLMSFFALRTSNDKRRKLWSSILEESCFVCVMPITPYRSFPASEVQVSKCQRMIIGVDGMMADTSSLHVLLSTLVDRSKHPFGNISFRYTLVTEEAVVAGNHIMARWIMTTTDAVKFGAKMEVSKQGMLCCKFNSSHKIIGLEIMFDVMAFMLQIKQASGSDGFSVVPNTVQTCQRTFDRPMVITLSEPPYTIIQVNNLWTEMTGYDADEVVGKSSCAILQTPDMDKSAVEGMMREILYKRSASAMLTNVTKSGEIFSNFLVVVPLCTDSRISYYLGLSMYHMAGNPRATEGSVSDKVLTNSQYCSKNDNVNTSTSGNLDHLIQTNLSNDSTSMTGIACLLSDSQN